MKKIILTFFLFLFLLSPVALLAQSGQMDNRGSGGSISLENPLGDDVDTPQLLIGRVINSVLGIVGSLALLMFVFGGITWMTSSGNAEKIKRGRDILIWAAIGMVVVFSAYGLTRVVIQGLSGQV